MRIESKRLIIRSLKSADEQAIIDMANDGSLNEIFGDCTNCSEWMKDWIQEANQLDKIDDPNGEYLAYIIEEKENHNCHCIIRHRSAFFTQFEIAFADFEKHFDIPSFSINSNDFIFTQT